MSGMIVERRDQVLMTLRSPAAFIASTFLARWSSTNGPFFSDRAMAYLRLFTMKRSVRLLFRVLAPLVGLPHGVTGWRPPEVRPSPPPCGWSTGFLATPRVSGRLPSQRLRPALARLVLALSGFDTAPTVAMQSERT